MRVLRAFTMSLVLSACAGHRAECPQPTTPAAPAQPAEREVRDAAGLVGVWVKFKPLPGKEEEAYAVVRDAVAEFKKTEPGDVVYVAFKNAQGEIIFFEVYQDEAARKAHSGSEYFKATFAKFSALVDMNTVTLQPTSEVLGGFIR